MPPNPKQWENEHNGLDLREDLGVSLGEPLSHVAAFGLLEDVALLPLSKVPLAANHLEHLQDGASRVFSGLATRVGDSWLVVYNDGHSENRVRATLLEELFHIRLNHPPTKVRLYSADGRHRDHNRALEDEAFGSGAAALVPYKPLREAVKKGMRKSQIASHFRVSQDLVQYRINVTRVRRRTAR